MRIRRRRLVLGVDPGLSGTGWALFEHGVLQAIGIIRGTVSTDQPLADRCGEIADRLVNELFYTTKTHVVIEMPQAMANIKGIAAQAGSVYKLAVLCGYLARAVEPARVTLVTPLEWKGQLPKDVVQRRVEQRIGLAKCRTLNVRSHAWDAVGLGLWFIDKERTDLHVSTSQNDTRRR